MPSKIKTAYGSFIPQTSDGADRKKHIVPVVYYPSGALKSLSLQEPSTIKVGGQVFPVELMT